MQLTKNEKKTLHLLLRNARITDSEIATKLNISSQAVGKIRRKLEDSVITNYTLNLNYAKLGVHVFAIGLGKITPEGQATGELEVEQALVDFAEIVSIYRIPRGTTTHILLFGFSSLNELDDFFHSSNYRDNINTYIEINDLFTFSHNSIIKNSPQQLLEKAITELGSSQAHTTIAELERFKKRLN